MDSLPPDPYKALGVAKDAKLQEIRTAHRKLVLKCHPDRVSDPTMKAAKQDEFQLVQQAYELLSDDARRLEYDERVKLLELRKKMGAESTTPRPTSGVGQHSYQTTEYRRSRRHEKWFGEAKSEPMVAKNLYQRSQSQYNENMPPKPKERSILHRGDKGDSFTTEASRHGLKRKPQGILVTKGHINGYKINAIPDTGAECNIVAANFAKKLRLQILDKDPSQCRLLRMANGKHIKTVGIAIATWSFASSPSERWEITFHVLSDFVYDVILGSGFLFATQTMSHHKERLYSGSEPSLVSYEYAKRRGWLMTMDIMDQNLLQFADGSLGKTEGSISCKWLFPTERVSNLRVTFHILRGCPHNVILGQDALEECDAFSEHEDAFLEVVPNMEVSGLNLVIWLPKKKKSQRIPTTVPVSAAASSAVQTNKLITDELQRRAVMDRLIGRMKAGDAKNTAMANEMQTRREYDDRLDGTHLPWSSFSGSYVHSQSQSDISRGSSRQPIQQRPSLPQAVP